MLQNGCRGLGLPVGLHSFRSVVPRHALWPLQPRSCQRFKRDIYLTVMGMKPGKRSYRSSPFLPGKSSCLSSVSMVYWCLLSMALSNQRVESKQQTSRIHHHDPLSAVDILSMIPLDDSTLSWTNQDLQDEALPWVRPSNLPRLDVIWPMSHPASRCLSGTASRGSGTTSGSFLIPCFWQIASNLHGARWRNQRWKKEF